MQYSTPVYLYTQILLIIKNLAGKLIWKCRLSHPVLPDKCKVKPAGKRIELKLKKAFSQQWTDLECKLVVENGTEELLNEVAAKSETEQMDTTVCNDDKFKVKLIYFRNWSNFLIRKTRSMRKRFTLLPLTRPFITRLLLTLVHLKLALIIRLSILTVSRSKMFYNK